MSRSRGPWPLAAPALALLAVGCAHCDRCDDFPVPSPTVAYDGSYTPVLPEGQMMPMGTPIVGPSTGAPPAASIPGPFSTTPPSRTDRATPPAGTGPGSASATGTPPAGRPPAADIDEPPLPATAPSLGEPPISPPPAGDARTF